MSTEDSRVKRPKLARTSARRSLAALFVPPVAIPPGTAAPGGTHANGASAQPWNDVIARSVDLGYRVIDDYVRQGERIARSVSDRGPAASAGLGAMAGFGDPQDLTRRMTQYAMEFSALWLQMLQGAQGAGAWPMPPFAGFAAPPPPPSSHARATHDRAHADDGPRPAARPAAATNGDKPVRVTVSVSSVKQTEVSLELRPEAGIRPMVVQSLRSPKPEHPRLSDVTLSGDGRDEHLTLRIRVPDAQPAGVYNGMLIDEESGLPVGTVSLRVEPE